MVKVVDDELKVEVVELIGGSSVVKFWTLIGGLDISDAKISEITVKKIIFSSSCDANALL